MSTTDARLRRHRVGLLDALRQDLRQAVRLPAESGRHGCGGGLVGARHRRRHGAVAALAASIPARRAAAIAPAIALRSE